MQHAQLRAFHAVAEHGGFSKAAHALGLTQPALSDQVRRLEQEFGVTLFHRRTRAVELTDLGRRLLVVTRQMFGYERAARDVLADAGALTSGSLSLAADAPDLAAKLVAAFKADHPEIVITLSIANAQSCMERVLSNAVDVAITAAIQVDRRLDAWELRREPLVAMVPAVGAGCEGLTLAAFVRQPVIFREARSVTQKLLEEELVRHGLKVDPVLLVEGREAAQEAVAHGLGVGVIARAEFNGDPRVKILPLTDCQVVMPEALIRLAERPPSTLLDAFWAMALTESPMTSTLHDKAQRTLMPGED